MRLDPITLHIRQCLSRNVVRCNSHPCLASTARPSRSSPTTASPGSTPGHHSDKTESISSPELALARASVCATEQQVMPDDHSAVEPLLPIPNRTVKRRSADDSEQPLVKVGHRQAIHSQKSHPKRVAFLFPDTPALNPLSPPLTPLLRNRQTQTAAAWPPVTLDIQRVGEGTSCTVIVRIRNINW